MSTPQTAADRLGREVPTPLYVDVDVWRRLAGMVVILPGDDGCHLWTGPPRSDGYGQVWIPDGAITCAPAADRHGPPLPLGDVLGGHQDQGEPAPARKGRPWRAHRAAYAAITGDELPAEAHLMHRCDQPLCVPITADALAAHLAPGSASENHHDREQKGRSVTPGQFGGRGRGRVTRWTRGTAGGPHRRSVAIHTALAEALAHVTAAALDDEAARTHIEAAVRAAETPAAPDDQLPLF